MPRTFAYLRVSTAGQTTDNQLQEIKAAGFKVEPRRVVTETISGNVATAQRCGSTRLLDRLEPGDVLVVTKLDRLGRNVMDVSSTVTKLAELGVRVHCLARGGVDLTSSTISAHKRETWLLEMPDAPMALTRSSAARSRSHECRPPGSRS